ncbi:transporter [Sphingomonas sp. CGMCC 1.13654]|uniref:Transporter n=1 Tax=Sphingomonas chungangi TaxID=2683589 RepID=A0A838L3I3_9SPHN|nr:transporter [Sphingomonas chungangi]MBA2933744.1 transporter [Sphingomonas chungangi]MVW55075.1 transporter [Sphingomonas chungangi]
MSKFRGAAAIAGIGQTPYYKRGTSPDPELKLALRAITAAADDAGIDVRDIDGFVSYASERSDPAKLMPALGTRNLRFASLAWFHGGALPATLNLATGAILSGQAEIVAVYRSMAENNSQRLRVVVAQNDTSSQYLVNGLESPAQILALRAQRLMEHDGVPRSALWAAVEASYHHARNNPRAYGRMTEMDETVYENARLVSEPYRLFDCSRENDGAACVLVVSAERAKDLKQKPAYILSAPMGTMEGGGALEENWRPYYGTAGHRELAQRMWAESGYGPKDVDVAQVYMNMTSMGIGSMIDHGFFTAEEAGDFCTFENFVAPTGKLPINTSGGDLAEGFIHGMGLIPEAVRQIRGTSVNQVPGAKLSLVTGGPGDIVSSTGLLGSEETL